MMIARVAGFAIAIVAGWIVLKMLSIVIFMHLRMNSVGMRGSFWQRLARQPLHLLAIWAAIGVAGASLAYWSFT